MRPAGTALGLTLGLDRQPNEAWRLVAPPERALETANQEMLAARGEAHLIPGQPLAPAGRRRRAASDRRARTVHGTGTPQSLVNAAD